MKDGDVGEGRKLVGVCIGLIATLVPALLFSDRVGSLRLWLPFASLAVAISALVFLPVRRWFAGGLGGAVAGAGALLMVAWWASWRSSIYSSEACLVALVGALPGLGLGALLAPGGR
jgi:hypothetical protein